MMMKNLISGTHKSANPQGTAGGYEFQKVKGSPRTKTKASTIPSKTKDEEPVHVQEEMKPVKAVQGAPPTDDVQPVSVDVNSHHISIAANMETPSNPRVNGSAALLEEELHSKKVSSVGFECDDAVTHLNVAAN
jgi:hypothetical protein